MPFFSVIVPTFNRLELLKRQFDQFFPSTTGTLSLLLSMMDLRMIFSNIYVLGRKR